MKSIGSLSFLLGVGLGSVWEVDDARIEARYMDYFNVYKMPTEYTFDKAQLFCHRRKSELVSVHNEGTHEDIDHAMMDLGLQTAWLGIAYNGVHWHFTDETGWNFERFGVGQQSPATVDDRAWIESGNWMRQNKGALSRGIICTGHQWALHLEKMTWEDANFFCQATYGTHGLATVHSENTDDDMRRALRAVAPNADAWIGMKDDEDENLYYWIDGTPDLYRNFVEGWSNGGYSQNCVSMSNRDDGWDDFDCDNKFPFFCAKPPGVTSIVLPNITIISDWEGPYDCEESDDPSCYGAVDFCRDTFGTTTGSIHSAEENEAIRQAALGLGLDHIWIGFEAQEGSMVWEWRDESPTTWEAWGPGFPVAHAHARLRVYDGHWENLPGSVVLAGTICNIPDDEGSSVSSLKREVRTQ